MPGDEWVRAFIKRNKLTHRHALNIKRSHAAVSKEKLVEIKPEFAVEVFLEFGERAHAVD